jgi:hypothetical protein
MSAAVTLTGSPTARRSTISRSQSQENAGLEDEKASGYKVSLLFSCTINSLFHFRRILWHAKMQIAYCWTRLPNCTSLFVIHITDLQFLDAKLPYRVIANLPPLSQNSTNSLKKSATALLSSKLANQAPKVSTSLHLRDALSLPFLPFIHKPLLKLHFVCYRC